MEYSEAVEIIKRHQKLAPVKLVPMATALGANVYYTEDWNDDVCGAIRRDDVHGGSRGYTILVNYKHPHARQRFTIAHEIAHLVLHSDLINEGIVDDILYRSGKGDRMEWDANRLAARILMPEKLVKRALSEEQTNLKELAKYFDVSQSAMSIRLGYPYGLTWGDAEESNLT